VGRPILAAAGFPAGFGLTEVRHDRSLTVAARNGRLFYSRLQSRDRREWSSDQLG
jgi:hypothetical protein